MFLLQLEIVHHRRGRNEGKPPRRTKPSRGEAGIFPFSIAPPPGRPTPTPGTINGSHPGDLFSEFPRQLRRNSSINSSARRSLAGERAGQRGRVSRECHLNLNFGVSSPRLIVKRRFAGGDRTRPRATWEYREYPPFGPPPVPRSFSLSRVSYGLRSTCPSLSAVAGLLSLSVPIFLRRPTASRWPSLFRRSPDALTRAYAAGNEWNAQGSEAKSSSAERISGIAATAPPFPTRKSTLDHGVELICPRLNPASAEVPFL